MNQQSRLAPAPTRYNRPERLKFRTTYGPNYDNPQYVAVKTIKGKKIQRIELHRGCPWGHEYCYEPQLNTDYDVPEIVSTHVQILDMNPLRHSRLMEILQQLSEKQVNGKVVYYEAVCGFDFRFMTQEIANAIKKARFRKVRLAWDGSFKDQYKLLDALMMLLKAGYSRKEISFFMIVNWRISKKECDRKLDLMKVWGIKVCDCCFDAGYRWHIPEFWTEDEIVEFRAKCRKHNQLVNFGIDPEEDCTQP